MIDQPSLPRGACKYGAECHDLLVGTNKQSTPIGWSLVFAILGNKESFLSVAVCSKNVMLPSSKRLA